MRLNKLVLPHFNAASGDWRALGVSYLCFTLCFSVEKRKPGAVLLPVAKRKHEKVLSLTRSPNHL